MNSENKWRESLATHVDCPHLSELLEKRQEAAFQAHISECPHCQAELALASRLQEPSDAAAVRSISKRLSQVNWAEAGRTGIVERPQTFWQRLVSTRVLAPASLALATVMVLVTVVQMKRSAVTDDFRETQQDIRTQVLRSQRLQGLSPLGIVLSAPKQCSWEAVRGAVEYEVELMEVDHASVWKQRVSTNSASIPDREIGKLLPGKRILWQVNAFGPNGQLLASSGTLEFTVFLQPANK